MLLKRNEYQLTYSKYLLMSHPFQGFESEVTSNIISKNSYWLGLENIKGFFFPRKIKKNVLIFFLDELLARSQCHSSTDLPRSHYLAHYVHSNLGYQCSAPTCFLHKGHWCLDRSKYKPLEHIDSNFPPNFVHFQN